jgi:hypothetical protein
MKHISLIRITFLKFILMAALGFTFFIPIHLSAQEAKYPWEKEKNDNKAETACYVAVKPGIYSPQTSDLKNLLHFDTGFNGEIAIGYRPNPNFALETGLGYFHTEAKETDSGQFGDITYAGSLEADLNVMPITFTLKGIIPYKQWELFALGGIKASGTADGLSGTIKLDASDMIFGGHLGLGFHYNVTPIIFVGAEGKYLWTSEAKLQDQGVWAKFKMDGILATAVIGFRF